MTTRSRDRKRHVVFVLVQRVANWFDARYSAAGRLTLLALVIALIFSLDPRQTLAYQLTAVLLAIFSVAYLGSYFRNPAVKISRQLPQFFTTGEPGEYSIEVTNQSTRLVHDLSLKDHLAIVDQQPRGAPPPDTRTNSWWEQKIGFIPWLQRQRSKAGARLVATALFSLGPSETRSIPQILTPLRRGVIQFAGAEIRATETLGLLRKVRVYAQADKIVSLPPRITLPNVIWHSQRRLHRGGYSVASSVGDSQEFVGLRDYRPGDSLRQIHWRSFAKLGKPVIREYQDEFFDHHALVLSTHIDQDQEALFESAVSAAASFVDLRQSGDSLLDLVVVDDQSWRITTGRGINHKHQLLEHLAIVRPKPDADTPLDADRVARAVRNCGAVVLISCTWDFSMRRTAELIRQQGSDLLAIQIVASRSELDGRHQAAAGTLSEDLTDILLNHHAEH